MGGRNLAKVALVALLALLFMLTGTSGHDLARLAPQALTEPLGPPPTPVETTGEAPHLEETTASRLGERQARHRAAARKLQAPRQAPSASALERPDAALNGAAFAIAAAALDRERTDPPARHALRPLSPLLTRGPPSFA